MVLGTGIITILCCLFGLFYNIMMLKSALSGDFDEEVVIGSVPYFYRAFYSMSAVCVVFHLVLIAFSIDLIRGSFQTLLPFTVVMALEVIYFFGMARMCRHPKFGYGVAGASGVANGGLMAQFFILLPLWAPVVLWYAKWAGM